MNAVRIDLKVHQSIQQQVVKVKQSHYRPRRAQKVPGS